MSSAIDLPALPTGQSTTEGVRPQDDLFRHVNSGWLASMQIPPDQAIYGAFHEMRDQSEDACRQIIEQAAASPGPAGSPEQLIGDLYTSFMDTAAVEAKGAGPAADLLAMVDAVTDRVEMFRLLGRLRRRGVGGLFGLEVDTDPDQPDRYTAVIFQAGLGLPDESYYRDEQYAEIRRAYLRHIVTMFDLVGVSEADQRAESVMALETELAARHWDRVRSRDRTQTHNPMGRADLDELVGAPEWAACLSGAGASDPLLEHVVVMQPSFLAGAAELLAAGGPDEAGPGDGARLQQWKNWLSWRVIRSVAPMCSAALVEENFDFYGRTLSGTPELRPRWKRGVALVESAVGEALGRIYVERTFAPAAKERMDELVGYLLQAYHRNISALPWMGEGTRRRALDKLASFNPKVGYPPTFRDYAGLDLRPDDLLGNVGRAASMEFDRDLAKIGAPVDRDEWFMTPQTVNAYYNPGMNEIVFPAAILRPPFFDSTADDAANFGAIGAVIGHEIGHGFDDQGSKYDGTGALSDWWTAEDRAAFEALTSRLIEQYSELTPVDGGGQHVNGALTIGENIGDLGGLGIAYRAWQLSLEGGSGTPAEAAGTTAEQRFFLSWAEAWRTKTRPAEVARRLAIDPHSPPEFRCNQVVRNLDEFHLAFDVQQGDAMWLPPSERVRIW